MTYGYVYKIVINHPGNSLDGCYYIGQHKLNKKTYYGSGIILENYKEKHGIINLNIEILCECISAEDLNKKEAELIGDLYLTDSYRKGGKCLNLKAGGNQPGMTEEVRNKIAEISKKRWEDPEYKKRVAISNSLAQKGKPRYKCRGRTLSLLTKMKIAQKALGRKRNNYTPWNKGIKYTEEQKKNIVLANKRNPYKSKRTGFKHSEITKQKISEMQKDWKWYTNGKEEIHTAICPNGWVAGRITKPVQGKKAFNNGMITKAWTLT